jgi:iduronate 2-sulfatase
LVEWKKPGGDSAEAEFELYDYVSDPLETKNLAAEQPDVVANLRAILATHPEARPQVKGGPAPAKAPRKAVDRKAVFKRRDVNGDGRLTLEEFLDRQPDPDAAPKRFPVFDADKDGFLTEDEYVKGGKAGTR